MKIPKRIWPHWSPQFIIPISIGDGNSNLPRNIISENRKPDFEKKYISSDILVLFSVVKRKNFQEEILRKKMHFIESHTEEVDRDPIAFGAGKDKRNKEQNS